jgi:hypothetical protein
MYTVQSSTAVKTNTRRAQCSDCNYVRERSKIFPEILAPPPNYRRQYGDMVQVLYLRAHNCVVTYEPHCYLELSVRVMCTDPYFLKGKSAVVVLKISGCTIQNLFALVLRLLEYMQLELTAKDS